MKQLDAAVTAAGQWITGQLFDKKVPLERYQEALGEPSRTMDAGAPAPAGYRNNQVHVFDAAGLYLTEHHASRLIESVNFVFDAGESHFPIKGGFEGDLKVGGYQFYSNLQEADLDRKLFARDLPGEYSLKHDKCWIGISAKGRRGAGGKRRNPRYVVRVSVCF